MQTGSTLNASALLRLLQLASPALPVGSYSYSEGLETLVEAGVIDTASSLQNWLEQELHQGSMTMDGAMVVRAYRSMEQADATQFKYWNQWWSAARETEELRQQSWQMGRSLCRLLPQLDDTITPWLEDIGTPCNWAIAFGVAAAHWHIDLESILFAYYQSWASNLIGAGVKLVPLGQSAGQQLLFNLTPQITATVDRVIGLDDGDLRSCSWGLALASSQHESLRVRLFQS